jgi:hypothetical protein
MKEDSLPDSIKKDMVLWQCVADKLIEALLDEEMTTSQPKSMERCRLTMVEENAIRYAGGFVIRKLLKKNEDLQCLKCLLEDSASITDSDSFLEYTKLWLKTTDRGGLCHISDTCFELLIEIEQCVYCNLQRNFTTQDKASVQEIEQIALRDNDVKSIWNHCLLDVDEKIRDEVLHKIIHEWVMLRGYSMTSKYLEDYKRAKQEIMKKKGTRKQLKKK